METEWLCHTAEGVGSQNPTPDTESRLIIILGAGKLCRQTYNMRQRKAIDSETAATMTTRG